jgi:hypothetical protein
MYLVTSAILIIFNLRLQEVFGSASRGQLCCIKVHSFFIHSFRRGVVVVAEHAPYT